MIIDHQKRYIIATPSKTGTTSLERMAKQNPDVFTVVRPYQHRMLVPDEFKGYRRWLLVRNNYERLVSIWSYLANPANYTQWGAKEVQHLTFEEFIAWWLDKRATLLDLSGSHELKWWRSPNLWLITNEECRDILHVDYAHCITVTAVPKLHPRAWGELKHLNASLHRPGDWQEYWTRTLWMAVAPLLTMPTDKPPKVTKLDRSRKRWDQIALNK